jgi:hypothetical protein
MTDKKKKPEPELDLEDLGVVVDDLPPLDGDAVDEADPADLAGYLADFESEEAEEGDDPIGQSTDEETAEELSHLEGSWIDDGAETPAEELDLGVEEEETGWSGEDAEDVPALEDDWFVEDGDPAIADDGGEEGPLDDELTEIDSSTWDDLGEDIDDDELEPVEDVMDRLGIALPEEGAAEPARGERVRVDPGVVHERQFLGPIGARIQAVAVDGGAVVGAGEGIFVLGADGMLHQASVEVPGYCGSVCVCGNHTFVGTDGAGAFRVSERDGDAAPINAWNTVWIGGRPVMGRVTTSFEIVGQPLGDGIRLLGRTGEGQLFASSDSGRTWSGPLTDGKCLAAAAVEGSAAVIALVGGAGSSSRLVATTDLESWRPLETPQLLAGVDQPGSVHLAAADGTLLAAPDLPGAPLACSFDGGQSWTERSGVVGVTALAVDPGGSGRIAVATYDAERDLGLVRVSEDYGQSWKIAAVAGQEPAARGRGDADDALGRVTCLVIEVGRTRRLYVTAGEGAQRIVLASGGLTQ